MKMLKIVLVTLSVMMVTTNMVKADSLRSQAIEAIRDLD